MNDDSLTMLMMLMEGMAVDEGDGGWVPDMRSRLLKTMWEVDDGLDGG